MTAPGPQPAPAVPHPERASGVTSPHGADAATPGQAACGCPLLCDNRDVMDALMVALSDPGKCLPRAPMESFSSWQRRAIVEHVAPVIIAAHAAIAAQDAQPAPGPEQLAAYEEDREADEIAREDGDYDDCEPTL